MPTTAAMTSVLSGPPNTASTDTLYDERAAEATGGRLPEPARPRLRDMVDYDDFMVVRLAGLLEEYRSQR